MAMTKKERQQATGLAIFLALAAPIAFWVYWRTPAVERANALQNEIDSLQAAVDTARADLARGTVEQLRVTVTRYEAALEVMRELVPQGTEITSLIDSVSSRAARRGVEIVSIVPSGTEVQGSFQVDRYQFGVIGPYDELGEFLSDVASLRRVMVPYNLTLDVANPADLTGILVEEGRTYLRAQFMVKTYVSPGGPASDAS